MPMIIKEEKKFSVSDIIVGFMEDNSTNHGDMAGIPFKNNCFAEIKGKRKYVRIFIKKEKGDIYIWKIKKN